MNEKETSELLYELRIELENKAQQKRKLELDIQLLEIAETHLLQDMRRFH